MLEVGRALARLGQGFWLSNVSVYVGPLFCMSRPQILSWRSPVHYITEIAPASRREMLVSIPQLMAAVGIPAGYFTCDGSIYIESSISWRVPFIFNPSGCYWYHLGCQLPLPTAVVPLALWQWSSRRCHVFSISPQYFYGGGRKGNFLSFTARREPKISTWRSIFQRKYWLRTNHTWFFRLRNEPIVRD